MNNEERELQGKKVTRRLIAFDDGTNAVIEESGGHRFEVTGSKRQVIGEIDITELTDAEFATIVANRNKWAIDKRAQKLVKVQPKKKEGLHGKDSISE